MSGSFVVGTFENRRVFVPHRQDGRHAQQLRRLQLNAAALRGQATTLPDGGLVIGVNLSQGENEARLVRIGGGGEVIMGTSRSLAIRRSRRSGRCCRAASSVAGTNGDPDALTAQVWLKAYDPRTGKDRRNPPRDRQPDPRQSVTLDHDGGVYFALFAGGPTDPGAPVPVIMERIRASTDAIAPVQALQARRLCCLAVTR